MNDPENWQAALDDMPWAKLTADVAIMTPGIAALGKEVVDRIIKTITVFDDFHHSMAASSRNGGRDHLGIGGRHHPGTTGDSAGIGTLARPVKSRGGISPIKAANSRDAPRCCWWYDPIG
jgi:hypothetical protein